MRKPQREQIKEAKRAYITPLNKHSKSATKRYSVYLDKGNGLEILWPSDCHEGSASKELLPNQTYVSTDNYPAYHFALSGCGYNKILEIRRALESSNKDIEVLVLDGWAPATR